MVLKHLFPISTILLICILIVSPADLWGQKKTGTEKKETSFPYQLTPSTDFALLPISTALLLGGGTIKLLHQPLSSSEILSLDKNSLLSIDAKTVGNWDPQLNKIRESFEPASFVAGLGLIGHVGIKTWIQKKDKTPVLTLLAMYTEGVFLSEGMVWLSKSLIKRPRPYAYDTQLSLDFRSGSSTNNESFISGNATVLFFNATFISQVLSDLYPGKAWLPYIWAGSHGLAALSGYWSVKSGMHFPTDILAGAIWGSGMAFLVTHLHKKRAQSIDIIPWATIYGKGAKIIVSLNP